MTFRERLGSSYNPVAGSKLLPLTNARMAREFDAVWRDLAVYNAEIARGIVHTARYDAKMAEKQRLYNEWQRREESE